MADLKSNLEKLQDWLDDAKKRGLVDIKLFRGSDSSVSVEEAAGEILKSLGKLERGELEPWHERVEEDQKEFDAMVKKLAKTL